MVAPVTIIIVPLVIAFMLGLFGKKLQQAAGGVMLLVLAFLVLVSAQWFHGLYFRDLQPEQVLTAGLSPPFSISLLMGRSEAAITLLVNFIGLLGGLYLMEQFRKRGISAMIIFLVFIMSLNVVVMTRDLFNFFVFLEVGSIGIAGLVLLDRGLKQVSAGFKYLVATGIISGFLLTGIIFAYHFAGSLYLNDLMTADLSMLKGGTAALFFILIAVILELKPFPANGWALDLYQGATPGISAMVSAASATAVYYMLSKLLGMAQGGTWSVVLTATGIITFLISNLLGIKQTSAQRLLGYSSVGQIGLLISLLGLQQVLGDRLPYIAATLLVSHALAKAGLFWIAGIVGEDETSKWSHLRKRPWLVVLFAGFAFALMGLPPFPSFFGKWELVMQLAGGRMFGWMALILAGSMFEAVYLFRWLGHAMKAEPDGELQLNISWEKVLPPALAGAALLVVSWTASSLVMAAPAFRYLPLLAVIVIGLLDFLPAAVKNTLVIAGMGLYFYTVYPLVQHDTLRLIFEIIFLGGGILTLIAGYSVKGMRKGFFPFVIMMYAGLSGLVEATTTLQFFFSWELMTIGSYFLIIRGKRSMPHALSYILFSLGGAYLILAGMGLAHAGQDSYGLDTIRNIMQYSGWAAALLAVGFMTKTASIGLHIWLPGAHAEAESDVSPMVSGILLKGGVFGLMVLFLAMGGEKAASLPMLYVLGWIGAITALGGNLLAVFQEDAKRLLAYSSVGNLGYILFAVAMLSHVGWLTALTYSINHFMFKTLLFLAIGGVVMRVKTHNMYEMGGLIKQMPISFIAVLIGIITLAGIPPLAGYGGKWLFYNAVIIKGWYFQGAIVFFSGTIAFLYCFKLIFTIFLGQPKDYLRKVKEVPVWYILPMVVLMAGIMFFSARPEIILQPIGNMLARTGYFPTDALTWDNVTAASDIGYWSGYKIMIVIGIMFALLLGWLMLMSRKAQKVKQFNIVYAGERPFLPETTHYAHNMFAPLNKALGFLVIPVATRFWDTVTAWVHDLAGAIRGWYTGNMQTYALHMLLFIIAVFFIIKGGM